MGSRSVPAYTLIEVVLVTGLLVLLSALTVPRISHLLTREQLPGSGRQLRSFLTLIRAHAAWDAKRYRIRFPQEQERDAMGGTRQPIIERENDSLEFPEEFLPVTEPWAVGATLLRDVWVAEVRLGRPTIANLQRLREFRTQVQGDLEDEFKSVENFDVDRPPVIIEADGTSEWVVFVLTQAPRGTGVEALDGYPRLELIVDGLTGLAWMQRPFFNEELDLFAQKGWPAVLRQDFLSQRQLTENDVLELHESRIQRRDTGATDAPAGTEASSPNESGATP